MKNNAEKIVIFDLGGVILKFTHMTICEKLANISNHLPEEVFNIIFLSGIEKDYDEGKITSKDFIENISKKLKISISPKRFRAIWADIFSDNEPVYDVIRKLKKKNYIIYMLSNTNRMHFGLVKRKFRIVDNFDKFILSYKIGERKPAPAMFMEAIKISGKEPGNLIFIDDREENIEGAKALGIKTILYHPKLDLPEELKKYGIIL
jgi:glucose-1-phosphatase